MSAFNDETKYYSLSASAVQCSLPSTQMGEIWSWNAIVRSPKKWPKLAEKADPMPLPAGPPMPRPPGEHAWQLLLHSRASAPHSRKKQSELEEEVHRAGE